ncbi:hypothetical protein BC835DRAFT_1309384 [Cytidiella melzeri]|nr:hypothetical protein BC835DRAFT_1309384 [Cytidiella melzeri]
MANSPTIIREKKLQELGPVKYIVGPDTVHYLFLSQFKQQYPNAKLIAPQAAIETVKQKSPNLTFNGAWGKDSPDTKYGFEDDVYVYAGLFLTSRYNTEDGGPVAGLTPASGGWQLRGMPVTDCLDIESAHTDLEVVCKACMRI